MKLKTLSQPNEPKLSITEIGGAGSNLVHIKAIDFFGQINRSPNGKFVFACQDGDYIGGRISGHRASGMGRIILISEGRVLWQREFERPNDGVVADSGHAVVNDCLFSDKLSGAFYVLSPAGDILLEKTFAANLSKCGINGIGTIAWCFTASSYDTQDSEKLFIFSIQPPKILLKIAAMFGGVRDVSFTGDKICVITDRGISYEFSFDGVLLNRDSVTAQIEKSVITSGTEWELLNLIDSQVHALVADETSNLRLAHVLELLDLAADRHVHSVTLSRLERYVGEFLLAMGDQKRALQRFDRAFALDQKVGLKRIMSKLRAARDCS